MKNHVKYFVFSCIAFSLYGCTGENGAVQPITSIAESDYIATVNGQPISKSSFDLFSAEITKQSKGANIPEEKLVQELINRELLLQEAKRNSLDQQPSIASRLEFTRMTVLYQAAVQDFLKNAPVSDEEAKDEYTRRISSVRSTEFKARHILLKSEEKATEIIKDLGKGGNFEELAKQHSTGPSGPKGGDLGWFNPKQMVPAFSQAVIQMKNGEFSKLPVKTKFGWHVILREDSRDNKPPTFADIKGRVVAWLQQKKLVSHIDALKNQAEIVIKKAKQESTEPNPEIKSTEDTDQ